MYLFNNILKSFFLFLLVKIPIVKIKQINIEYNILDRSYVAARFSKCRNTTRNKLVSSVLVT